MPEILDIQKVSVGPRYVTARVRVADDAPLTTDQDLIGTTRIYNLMPEICDHVCLGDEGSTFKDAMPSTELPHLFEHVAVELMARSGIGGDISCGRTREVEDGDGRTLEVQLDCPDDVLTIGALSSAEWMMQWAFANDPDEPEPNVDATAQGLAQLVASLSEQPEESSDTEEAESEAGSDEAEDMTNTEDE